jgi:hypothetical protein
MPMSTKPNPRKQEICRQIQAMKSLSHAIQTDEATAEETPRQGLAAGLTQLLQKAERDDLMDAIGQLLATLSGASLQNCRRLTLEYPEIGVIEVEEGPLGNGVGSRLWGISHRLNLMLIEQSQLFRGRRVLELGSGVGSTGATCLKRCSCSAVRLSALGPLALVCLPENFGSAKNQCSVQQQENGQRLQV